MTAPITTRIRNQLRIDPPGDLPDLVDQLNAILERLQTQTGILYALEPTAKPWRTVTAATTVLLTDFLVQADTTGGNVTVTLPAADAAPGRVFHVKKLVAANTLTIAAAGSDLIDGAATVAVTTQWQTTTVLSVGTAWRVL